MYSPSQKKRKAGLLCLCRVLSHLIDYKTLIKVQYSKFPQLPHRPLRGILISGSPHREFRVSCFHCLKNFTSAELCALPFIKAKVCQTETKENEASLFLFDFYIHTCIAISSVRLQAKSLLALTYIFIYCFFLFSLCLT